jgi:hypothetical protein
MIVRMRSLKLTALLSETCRYLFAVLFTVCFLSVASHARIIESNLDTNNTGDEGNVSIVDSPRRAGSKGFKHSIPNGSKRAELSGNRVAKGGTYWYGWSFLHPSSPGIPSNGWTILSQWFIGDRPASSWPCGGAGHKISARDGQVVFNLQHSTSGGSDITCKTYNLASWDQIKDKWVDIIVNAKWTDGTDGFVKAWIRIGGDSGTWVQKIDYKGRSQANGSTGPYFKYGAYTETIQNGPRVVYTDEYRLGDSSSSFNEVTPGGKSTVPTTTPTPTNTTTIIDDSCSSLANFTKISGGTWSSTNGQCALTSPASVSSGIGNLLVHNTAITGDFILTASGSATATANSWDDFAIIFNYQNSTNYYYASFNESNNDTTNGIFKVVNGTHTQIADFSAVTAAGTMQSIKVERIGSSIKVYRGSTSMGQATDSSFSGGKVGFGTTNNSANFDNLKVVK